MSSLGYQRLSEIEMKSIRFADKPLWQFDAFHLLAGRKGVGKGTVLADLIAKVTRGEFGLKRNVLWIASEDSAAIDIGPRVAAAKGDADRVSIVRDWVQLPADLEKLSNTIIEIGEVGLVGIDPVGNHIAGKNSNGETDIRDAIGRLNQLADDHATIVVGVRHLSQKDLSSNGAIAGILGSSAWVQVPRVVNIIAKDDEQPDVSHVQCVAGNRLPSETPGRSFRIEGVELPELDNPVTCLRWLGDSTKDVEDLVGRRPRKQSGTETAREMILDLLEDAPGSRVESDRLDAEVAAKTGLAAQTIRNVRAQLKNDGLVRAEPEKDDSGTVEKWYVVRTNAPRTVTGSPVTESIDGTGVFGSTKPVTDQKPTHPRTVTGLNSTSSNRNQTNGLWSVSGSSSLADFRVDESPAPPKGQCKHERRSELLGVCLDCGDS